MKIDEDNVVSTEVTIPSAAGEFTESPSVLVLDVETMSVSKFVEISGELLVVVIAVGLV